MPRPCAGTGSLSPTFVPARTVVLAVKPACAITPVSYTHLDVYKRQLQGFEVANYSGQWQAVNATIRGNQVLLTAADGSILNDLNAMSQVQMCIRDRD